MRRTKGPLLLVLLVTISGCATTLPLESEVHAERTDTELVPALEGKKLEPGQEERAERAGVEAAHLRWHVKCVVDHWRSGPFRYQDQAERAGRLHECSTHLCVRTTYVY